MSPGGERDHTPSVDEIELEPVDVAQHLDKVGLYLTQVCRIAGISRVQLDYWTARAQIPTAGRKHRIFDVDALKTVMLIKQAREKGLSLEAAIAAAARFKAERDGAAPA